MAAVALAPDGSVYSVGYIQSDTPGDVTFGSTTAATAVTVAGFAANDGFLTKARFARACFRRHNDGA